MALAACAGPASYDGDAPAETAAVDARAVLEALPDLQVELPHVDAVVVEKASRRMYLKQNGMVLRAYDIALGFEPEGHKTQRGDGRTPEGRYTLDFRNPNSQFHRSMRVSYPSREDVARAERLGVDPGNNIMIHGLPDDWAWMGRHHRRHDWTEGCIAVTNEEMDEIWAMVDTGTPIYIRP